MVLGTRIKSSYPWLPDNMAESASLIMLLLMLMLMSHSFLLRHKYSIGIRKTKHIRSACAYAYAYANAFTLAHFRHFYMKHAMARTAGTVQIAGTFSKKTFSKKSRSPYIGNCLQVDLFKEGFWEVAVSWSIEYTSWVFTSRGDICF